MKTSFLPRLGRRIAASAFLLLAATLPRVSAAPSAPADNLVQQEVKQQQIRVTIQRVGDQLDAIVGEFERNGISGEDVKVLRAIRGVLGRLSEQDLEKVLAYLREARAEADPAASTRRATEAFAGQKSVIVQLKQLVLEYQRHQALYEISLRLKELAARQSANMWLGVALAKSAEGKSSFQNYDENQKISLRYQQSEQLPLKDEVALILARLDRLSKEITDGPAAERPKVALRQAADGGLMPALETAVEELKEDKLKLLSAIGNEKKARDQLREMARLLILSQDTADALRQALLELERAIDAEKKVMADTRAAKKKDEADKRATDQAEVVDATDLIRRDIDSLAPIASEHLRAATDRMQEARAALSTSDDPRKRTEKALPKQSDALARMDAARHALQEQLAKAESLETQPENALADLRDLQEKVRELIKQEEALKQDAAAAKKPDLPAKAPKQGELKDQAQDAQAKAATRAPDAAESLGEASSQMQKSQNSLAQQQNNEPAQQASIDALKRADEQLGEQIAALEQAEKDLAQLEELLEKLSKVIEDQQAVESSTAKEAVKPQPDADANKELAASQEKLGGETGQLQEKSASAAPEATKHLDRAKQNMAQARSELDKRAPKSAQPGQERALSDLYQAKKEMENKADELRNQLGMPAGMDEESLEEAAKRIAQAQKNVEEALSELQQAPPGLMESLQKAQQEIAEALGEKKQDAPEAKPVADAEQAASQAAAQLGRSNLPKAIAAMKSAGAAMKQAGPKPDAQAGENTRPLAGLEKRQAEVQKAAEALLAAQEAAPARAMQAASKALEEADKTLSPVSAGQCGRLPRAAQSAVRSAQGSCSRGSAQASAGENCPAQQNAASAAEALAQAQAALALAKAGMGTQMAQGKGEQPGQGQGKQPGQGQGQGKGRGTPPPQGSGDRGNWDGSGGADGARREAVGEGQFTRLPGRDRKALLQSQAEKYPQEYGALVEQYLRNLSDQAGEK
jgi:hypothetical protein